MMQLIFAIFFCLFGPLASVFKPSNINPAKADTQALIWMCESQRWWLFLPRKHGRL